MKNTEIDDFNEVERTIEQIKPLLMGKGHAIQAAVLGDLLALWVHGHRSLDGDPDKTVLIRDEVLAVHIDYVKALVEARDIE